VYYAFIIRIMYIRSGPNSNIRRDGCYGRLLEVILLTINYAWLNDFFPTEVEKAFTTKNDTVLLWMEMTPDSHLKSTAGCIPTRLK